MNPKRKLVLGIVVLALLIGGFILVQPKIDEFLKPFGRSPPILILRDLLVVSYAHIMAGDDIPFELVTGIDEIAWNKIDYSRYEMINSLLTYKTKTNSVWVVDKMRMIVPFYEYEGIIEFPIYPSDIYITPYNTTPYNPGSDSFHILGQAYVERGLVLLNERFFMEDSRRDLRQVYSTMVHELIHQQGGSFNRQVSIVNGVLMVTGSIEPNTQAATIEVLAGMCHYRDEVACKAFWSAVESYARGSLLMRLRIYGYEDWYDKIANLLWRDSKDEIARDKSLRHWMLDDSLREFYYGIINNYQKVPWEDIVIEGICGKGLNTGFTEETSFSTYERPEYQTKYMMFDDTKSMMGEFLVNMICKMPRGPEVH